MYFYKLVNIVMVLSLFTAASSQFEKFLSVFISQNMLIDCIVYPNKDCLQMKCYFCFNF